MRLRSRISTISLCLVAASVLGAARDGAARPRADVSPRVSSRSAADEIAVFAGGCFWGIEAVFEHVKGVKLSESGYSGGKYENPSYEDVSTGRTGHAESVRVVYDPAQVSYAQLLRIFFSVAHNPTQLNFQGPDIGTQYRSAIFYMNEAQKRDAQTIVDSLTAAKTFKKPIVTQIVPLKAFYAAEAYHQDYLAHHPNEPYIVFNDAPKLRALQKTFPQWYRP